MLSCVSSVVLVGAEPRPVDVEVFVGGGQPSFHLVGLPDTAIREAKERVRAAIQSSGYPFPGRRVVVNLAPADVPKGGSAYDLPIALGVLAASKEIPAKCSRVVALGELALDGTVRAVRGGLGAALVAARSQLRCLLPPASAAEAGTLGEAMVSAVSSLAEAVAVGSGESPGSEVPEPVSTRVNAPDLGEIRGQATARRALEIAAAGEHNLLMTGPPGGGKTMLARCLPGILPRLEADAAAEVALMWAAAGLTRTDPEVPPFRSPHHSASLAALLGGGSGVPVPGEISLAHRGALFLDELGEFPVHLLDALRQPMEQGAVVIARRGASVRFASTFQLVAATNPCPCGYAGDRLRSCTCSQGSVARYRRRLSGPLLDRFDLVIRVPRVDPGEMARAPGETSAAVASRVAGARVRQRHRGRSNARLDRSALDTMRWTTEAVRLLEQAMRGAALTARGWERTRRVAVTIADLAAGNDSDGPDSTIGPDLVIRPDRVIGTEHVMEALAYRGSL
ncbi:MAG: YifB family Mg chelatase-like AAA ATPase [Acidimicrobiia bacterium]|nr:YifB family Mg chelatase-like AAA ATPase [Acidimicrobiia bacterium]